MGLEKGMDSLRRPPFTVLTTFDSGRLYPNTNSTCGVDGTHADHSPYAFKRGAHLSSGSGTSLWVQRRNECKAVLGPHLPASQQREARLQPDVQLLAEAPH
jgi:hypothetical protein